MSDLANDIQKVSKAEVKPINHPAVVDQAAAVLSVLENGLNKGLDADSLEKILTMQERVLDRQAEQAFNRSLVLVQQEMPIIGKSRDNAQTRSQYADMEDILKVAPKVYTSHGFSLSYGTADSKLTDHVRVIANLMHVDGHSKQYAVDIPLDMTGIQGATNKTKTHGTGSAITYGQRYLIKLIFNLNTGDDDDNAAGGDTRSAMDIDNQWIARMNIIKTLIPSILQIKEALRDNNYHAFFEAWGELSGSEQDAIWYPAPTKGGILTTVEREQIKGSDCKAIAKEIGYTSPQQ